MNRQEYYSYQNTYDYREESPYPGAIAEGVDGAKILSGDVTWNAEITWDEASQEYKLFKTWTDHGGNFSDLGEGPLEERFLDDMYAYFGSMGVDSTEID